MTWGSGKWRRIWEEDAVKLSEQGKSEGEKLLKIRIVNSIRMMIEQVAQDTLWKPNA
jgi:hypothetical protein